MKSVISRDILIVLDGVGVGALPDAAMYDDEGSNTLVNLATETGGLELPNIEAMGLGNIARIRGVNPAPSPIASYGSMLELSPGKDTITGHWEMMGIQVEKAFPTYPHGFPQNIIEAFERSIGRKIIGNFPASGTEIIEKLGKQHLTTGRPIVYTSADSVFQIAAHEEIIPIRELYEICQTARSILVPPHGVARVIARPFIGKPGGFSRTHRRKDFSIPPPRETALDLLRSADIHVLGIGKIWDIFSGRGISESIHTEDNADGIERIIHAIKEVKQGLIFTNLIDFDMVYGHRNDCKGFARALENFDAKIPEIISAMKDDDLLIVTADHGCDPTTPSTDHSRERVPLIAFSPSGKKIDLGTRSTFSDVGKTILEGFGVEGKIEGKSFLSRIFAAI